MHCPGGSQGARDGKCQSVLATFRPLSWSASSDACRGCQEMGDTGKMKIHLIIGFCDPKKSLGLNQRDQVCVLQGFGVA